MKFDYKEVKATSSEAYPHRKKVYRPDIKVTIKHTKSIDVNALVDSGADYCVFPSELGEYIGFDVKSGKRDVIIGIGNKTIPVFFHNITLIVDGHEFDLWCGFAKEVPKPILGQLGFFEKFDVSFCYRKKCLEIKLTFGNPS